MVVQGTRYEARYNIMGTHCIDSVFDMHPYPAPPSPTSHTGDLYKIHHNTIGVTDQAAVSIGAIPGIGLFVDHNRFCLQSLQQFTSGNLKGMEKFM